MRAFPQFFRRANGVFILFASVLPALDRASMAEPLPNTPIAGFEYPLSEATLTGYVRAMGQGDATAAASVYRHAWGLWTALLQPSHQTDNGQPLRIFETWVSLDDLAADASEQTHGIPPRFASLTRRPRRLAALRFVEQSDLPAAGADEEPVIGAVKFDPTAAQHIIRQQLLQTSALTVLLEAGAIQVPPFPATALAAKPVYQLVHRRDLVGGRYFRLKVWTGPPASPQAWGPDQWTEVVWVDFHGGGRASGEVDPVGATDASSRTENSTYPLAAFVHHRVSPADAQALVASSPDSHAEPGDVALLVAMHVSGREMARWTWQTYWWTPAPETPPAPSSAAIAAARPPQLDGAARHYAMAVTYAMLSPDQPYTGGTNATPAVYAYNPWIEARFGPADLPDSQPGFAPDGTPAANNTGVETNCLSCHAQATFHPAGLQTAPRFTGARYVDLGDPRFVGALQTDFVWSLPRHAR